MDINNLVAMTTGQKPAQLALTKEGNQTETPLLSTTEESTPTENSASTPPASSSTAQGEEFTTFLTLLTAQIRNQDPLAPLDSTQFVEQLATFSNLELQAQGNQVLEDIAALLAQNLVTTNAQNTADI